MNPIEAPSLSLIDEGDIKGFCNHAVLFLQNESHLWCGHPDIMAEIAFLFPFNEPNIKNIKIKVDEDFRQCFACINEYHRVIDRLREKYNQNGEDTDLFDYLFDQDIERIKISLSESMISDDADDIDQDKLNGLSITLFELLNFPDLLFDTDIQPLFSTSLVNLLKHHDFDFTNQDYRSVTGLYFLALHKEPVIRDWAFDLAKKSPIETMEHFTAIHPTLKLCSDLLAQDDFGKPSFEDDYPGITPDRVEFWCMFGNILELISPHIVADGVLSSFPGLFDTIFLELYATSPVLRQALKCLDFLLENASTVQEASKPWKLVSIKPEEVFQSLRSLCLAGVPESIQLALTYILRPLVVSSEALNSYTSLRDDVIGFLLDFLSPGGRTQHRKVNNTPGIRRSVRYVLFKIIHSGLQMPRPMIPHASLPRWAVHLVDTACPDLSRDSSLGSPSFSDSNEPDDRKQVRKCAIALLVDVLMFSCVKLRKMLLKDIDAKCQSTTLDALNTKFLSGVWDLVLQTTPADVPLAIYIALFKTHSQISLFDPVEGKPIEAYLTWHRKKLGKFLQALVPSSYLTLVNLPGFIEQLFGQLLTPNGFLRASFTLFLKKQDPAVLFEKMVVRYLTRSSDFPLPSTMLVDANETIKLANMQRSWDGVLHWGEKMARYFGSFEEPSSEDEAAVINECRKVEAEAVNQIWTFCEAFMKHSTSSAKEKSSKQVVPDPVKLNLIALLTSWTKAAVIASFKSTVGTESTILGRFPQWSRHFCRLYSSTSRVGDDWLACAMEIGKLLVKPKEDGGKPDVAAPFDYTQLMTDIFDGRMKTHSSLSDATRAELGGLIGKLSGRKIGNLGKSWFTDLPALTPKSSSKPLVQRQQPQEVIDLTDDDDDAATSKKGSPMQVCWDSDDEFDSKYRMKTPFKLELKAGSSKPDTRPLCWYSGMCYRKNPQHWRQYQHPTSAVPSLRSSSINASIINKLKSPSISSPPSSSPGKTIASPPAVRPTDSIPSKPPPPPLIEITDDFSLSSDSEDEFHSSQKDELLDVLRPLPSPSTEKQEPKVVSPYFSFPSTTKPSSTTTTTTTTTTTASTLSTNARPSAPFLVRPPRKLQVIDLPGLRVPSRRKSESEPEAKPKPKAALDALYKTILLWDYKALDQPRDVSKLRMVPSSFGSVEEYVQTFEPLLLEELRGQIEKAISEDSDPAMVKNELKKVERVNDFHVFYFKKVVATDAQALIENDLVLLCKDAASSMTVYTFGKVEKSDKKGSDEVKIRLLLTEQGGNPLTKRSKEVVAAIRLNSEWLVRKVNNLTTTLREFQALHNVSNLHLLPFIISPKSSSTPSKSLSSGSMQPPSPSLSPFFRNLFADQFNESQCEAIAACSASSASAIHLLQGPPGTGKTRSIVGLISVLLQNNASANSFRGSKNAPARSQMLVCAPSNSAVDEIVLRLMEGIWFDPSKGGSSTSGGSNGNQVNKRVPKICRVGVESSIHPMVKSVSLDSLMTTRSKERGNKVFAEAQSQQSLRDEMDATNKKYLAVQETISKTHDLLMAARKDLDAEDDESVRNEQRLTNEMTRLHDKKQALKDKMNNIGVKKSGHSSRLETARRELMTQVLREADIIACTLSGSGHEQIASMAPDLEVVIIDEATQAVEVSSLIPLQHGARKAILVGDPNQLPATVLSQLSTKYRYETSLFQRLMTSGLHVHVLKTQYRMHPAIRTFPGKFFYQGVLEDGPNIVTKTYIKRFHGDKRFGPFVFYALESGTESRADNSSLRNLDEARFVVSLIENLLRLFPGVQKEVTIGVITPYKQQMVELRHQLTRKFPSLIQSPEESSAPSASDSTKNFIEVNTVDAFQGREKDIVIFSCVRSASEQGHVAGIGFLSDTRRMNVALTRPRFSLWVVGNPRSLSKNETWNELIEFSRRNNFFREARSNLFKDDNAKQESVDMDSYHHMFSKHTSTITISSPQSKSPVVTASPNRATNNINSASTSKQPSAGFTLSLPPQSAKLSEKEHMKQEQEQYRKHIEQLRQSKTQAQPPVPIATDKPKPITIKPPSTNDSVTTTTLKKSSMLSKRKSSVSDDSKDTKKTKPWPRKG